MKSAIPWLCAVLLLAGTFFLYSSGRQKDVELSQLRLDAQELPKLRAEIEDLKKAPVQNDELVRLRKDNEDILRLRSEVHRLREQAKQLTNQVLTAQSRQSQAQEQQQKLAQLSVENEVLRNQTQQIKEAAVQSQQAAACINNLRQIDGAKQQWALENKKTADAAPAASDLLPYFPQGIFPVCPSGGVYTINSVNAEPACSIPGHALPKQQ